MAVLSRKKTEYQLGVVVRIGNLNGRAAILCAAGAVDVHDASEGRFGPDLAQCYENWSAFIAWAQTCAVAPKPFATSELGAPSPTPRQSFGIGLNYRKHAEESGIPAPEFPPTFTKFPSCIAGPNAIVELSSTSVDWEVELVVVIGVEAKNVNEADAWSYVAGVTVGQDLSDRPVQTRPPVPQFSLGKSFANYGPTGPWVVTIDELANPDDLAISCSLNGEVMQDSRTSDLIFSVPALINRLSGIVTLLPGDVIFTGTPGGVGMARRPPRFLSVNDVLESTIEGIGSFTTTFTSR